MALISNPDNPVSPPGVLAIGIIFTFIVWFLAGVRFWVLRHYSYRKFSPRWVSNVAVMLIVVFVSVGLGLLFYAYHMVYQMRDLERTWDSLDFKLAEGNLTEAEMTAVDMKLVDIETQLINLSLDTMKSSLAWRLSSTTALWLVKFSIVMVYVELWENLTKRIRWLMYSTLCTIILTYIATITLFCIGMPADNWFVRKMGMSKTSAMPIITEYTYGAANVLTDIQVLTIALWSLHIIKLPQSKLYAISILLFMGCVTISLAIARAILYDTHIRNGTPLNQSVDLIGLIEPLVASWLACLPALRVLFRLRRRSRVEEIEARIRELRSSGHERLRTAGGANTSQIGRAYGGEGEGCGDDTCGNCESHGSSNQLSVKGVGVTVGHDRARDEDDDDDDQVREIVMERGDSVRLSSFSGSDGSTQVGEWRPDGEPGEGLDSSHRYCAWAKGRSRGFTNDSTIPFRVQTYEEENRRRQQSYQAISSHPVRHPLSGSTKPPSSPTAATPLQSRGVERTVKQERRASEDGEIRGRNTRPANPKANPK
ncbi:hypothetical protein BDZ91DRAFT_763112 [Kalaharituber pfeilii]|nr:hypothetical protein BDZ91DRAFT_763112 [Kalaharituber pfeilii]